MLNFRLSHSLLLSVAAVFLSGSRVLAGPIAGQYNNKPNSGLILVQPNIYTIKKSAQFNGNGKTNLATGLAVRKSLVTVEGGQFNGNRDTGFSVREQSYVVLNGGLFERNLDGINLGQQSRIWVNSGSFHNNRLNLALRSGSFAKINGGSFRGALENGSFGVQGDGGASALVQGGEFFDHQHGLHFFDSPSLVVSGGNFHDNLRALYVCSSTIRVTDGQFRRSLEQGAVFTTHANGGPMAATINGGIFSDNVFSGATVLSGTGVKSTLTINRGNFVNNGFPINELLIGSVYNSAGLQVYYGGKAVINGGTFSKNLPAGVQVFTPNSFATINGGDFRNNGGGRDNIIPAGPGNSFGLFVHSGGGALINGGNFSDNHVSLELGVAYQPLNYPDRLDGYATVNGGTFHAVRNAVHAANGSVCTLNGGDFSGLDAISAMGKSKIRIFGGKTRAERFDFDAQFQSTIELTGVFDGYDNSKGDIVLKGTGNFKGQLKNNARPQTFRYRADALSKIILHPMNPAAPAASSAPSA